MADDGLVFVCIQCGHGCTSYEDLTEHMEDHEDQKPDLHQLKKSSDGSRAKGRFNGKSKKRNTKRNNNLREEEIKDLKVEGKSERQSAYSYPSYISIGGDSLDSLDTNWAYGRDELYGKEASFPELSNVGTPAVTMPRKNFPGKKTESTKKTKKISNLQRKRQASVQPSTSLVVNAKKKKKEGSKKKQTTAEAKEFRRRSTNSMRLRRLAPGGEICHEEMSEMSDSDRLVDVIRISKIETTLSQIDAGGIKSKSTDAIKPRTNVNWKKIERLRGRFLKGKKTTGKGMVKRANNAAAKETSQKSKIDVKVLNSSKKTKGKAVVVSKNARNKTAPQSASKAVPATKARKISKKKCSVLNHEVKAQVVLKRGANALCKSLPLNGKIMPIQGPMIWKLVNSNQLVTSNRGNMPSIEQLKNNATLKFTDEQKVMITFSQANDNSKLSTVKTIIANVASTSKTSSKNSSGVRTHQAVLLPVNSLKESGPADPVSGNASKYSVKLLRSTAKKAANLSNYTIIPLSSIMPANHATAALPEMLPTKRRTGIRGSGKVGAVTSSPLAASVSLTTTSQTSSSSNGKCLTKSPAKLTITTTTALTTLQSNLKPVAVTNSQLGVNRFHNTASESKVIINQSNSAASAAAALQSSRTLVIKNGPTAQQVLSFLPTTGNSSIPTIQLIPNNITANTPVANSLQTTQFMRPIILAPRFAAPRTGITTTTTTTFVTSNATTPVEKNVPNTRTVFLTTSTLNAAMKNPGSAFQLTLSPNKSLVGGAIPLFLTAQKQMPDSKSLPKPIQITFSTCASPGTNPIPKPTQTQLAQTKQATNPTPVQLVPTQALSMRPIIVPRSIIASPQPTITSSPQKLVPAQSVILNKSVPVQFVKSVTQPMVATSINSLPPAATVQTLPGGAIGLSVLAKQPAPITKNYNIFVSKSKTESSAFASSKASKEIVTQLLSESSLCEAVQGKPEFLTSNNNTTTESSLSSFIVGTSLSLAIISSGSTRTSSLDSLQIAQPIISTLISKIPLSLLARSNPSDYKRNITSLARPAACTGGSTLIQSQTRPLMSSGFSTFSQIKFSGKQSSTADVSTMGAATVVKPSSAGTSAAALVVNPSTAGTSAAALVVNPSTAGTSAAAPVVKPLSAGTSAAAPVVKPSSAGTSAAAPVVKPSSAGTSAAAPVVKPSSAGTPAAATSLTGTILRLIPMPAAVAAKRNIEIRPAVAVNSPTPYISPKLASPLSIVYAPAVKTLNTTPVVTTTPITKMPERLPISIKLASFASGTILKNARFLNTMSNTPSQLKVLKSQEISRPVTTKSQQIPLLPKPTKSVVTLLPSTPLTSIPKMQNGSIPSAVSTTGSQFSLAYLTSVPLQIARQQVTNRTASPTVQAPTVIQSSQRTIYPSPFASLTQVPAVNNANNVPMSRPAMMIPVSLSMPGGNKNQLTTSMFLSPVYSVVTAASVNKRLTLSQANSPMIITQPQALQKPTTVNTTSRLQKIAPHPASSIFNIPISQVVCHGRRLSSPSTANQNYSLSTTNALPMSPLQPNSPLLSTKTSVLLTSSQNSTVSTTAACTVATVSSAAYTVGIPPSTKANTLFPASSSVLGVVNTVNSIASPIPHAAADLTNSLQSILKTDIKQGSTITINIQGSDVTYAVKDGQIFAVPHDQPAKKEEPGSANSVLDPPRSTSVPVLPTPLCSSTSVAEELLKNQSFLSVDQVSESTDMSFCPPKDPLDVSSFSSNPASFVPCSKLPISVPTSLLENKPRKRNSSSERLSSSSSSSDRKTSSSSECMTSSSSSSDRKILSSSEHLTFSSLLSDSRAPSSSENVALSTLSERRATSEHVLFQSDSRALSSSENIALSTLPERRISSEHASLPSGCRVSSLSENVALSTLSERRASSEHVTLSSLPSDCRTSSGHTPFSSLPSDSRALSSSAHMRPVTESNTQLFGLPSANDAIVRANHLVVQDSMTESGSRKRKISAGSGVKFGFECDVCSCKFDTYNLMWRHRKIHLSETFNTANTLGTQLPRALCPKFAVCQICNKWFKNNADLERHHQLDNRCKKANTIKVEKAPAKENTLAAVTNIITTTNDRLNNNTPANSVNLSYLTSVPLQIARQQVTNRTASPTLQAPTVIQSSQRTVYPLDGFSSLNSCEASSTTNSVDTISEAMDIELIGDILSNFDCDEQNQVFEDPDIMDVKQDIKSVKKHRRSSSKSTASSKGSLSRRNSALGKNCPMQKRAKRRSRITISDDEEEGFEDTGLDLDGEFIATGKLYGEFTCSRCDRGFQNEDELDEHNEMFHDSLRYNFRERKSLSTIEYFDDFEEEFE